MKALCILVIAFALLVSYQSNPIGTLVIGGGIFFIYALIKTRKAKSGSRGNWIFSKGSNVQNSQMEDLVSLLVIQNLLNQNPQHKLPKTQSNEADEENELEAIKREILALFDEKKV